MVSSDAQVLTVRLDVLRDIIIEMAAALPPHCASRLVNAIGGRLTQRLCDIVIAEPADDAMVSDLAPILAALHRSCGDGHDATDPAWATTLKRQLATAAQCPLRG